MRDRPEKQTCETCDWWCYGTWPDNTCDRWERTLYEVDVPDEVIAMLLNMPTEEDIRKLEQEIGELEHIMGEMEGGER